MHSIHSSGTQLGRENKCSGETKEQCGLREHTATAAVQGTDVCRCALLATT